MSDGGNRTGRALAAPELASLLEALPDAAVVAAADGAIRYANTAFAELSGHSPRSLPGTPIEDLVPATKRASHRQHRAEFAARRRRRPMSELTCVSMLCADGSELPVDISLAPIELGDEPLVLATVRSIAPRQAAEEARIQSERRYRALVDRNPAGIFVSTPDGRLLESNDAFARICGYRSAAELQGRPLRDLYFDAADRERFVAELRRGGSLDHFEERLRRRDGSEAWVLTAASLLDEPGRGEVIQGAVVEVTAVRAAEEAVRASERRYRELFRNNAAGVFRSTLDGRLIECNETFARIFGYDEPADLAGSDCRDHYWDPADLDRLLEQLRLAGSLRDVEVQGRKRDGSEVWALVAAALGRDGDHEIIEGTLIDVTERRRAQAALAEAEEQFRALIESMQAVVWRADAATFEFTYVSGRGEDLLGYPLERWLGDPEFWPAAIHPDDRESTIAFCRRETDALRDHSMQYRMMRADGRTVWVHDSAHVVTDNGRPVAIVGLFVDISERRALEEQLRQALKMEAVGRLAGGIAHDFNNLMGVILGYAEMLLEREPPGATRERLEEIRLASERAAGLTRQLLAYSRRQMLKAELVDLNGLVGRLESMLTRVLGEDVRLETSFADDLWRVEADPGQLEQVLLNLAVNARDAMPGGGRLEITTANVELDAAFVARNAGAVAGQYARLTVSDDGEGMDPDVLAHVFEPFFTTKPPGKGTGLGLATVYGIVKQSGGYITVESRPRRGTSVTVYLPRSEARADPTQQAPTQARPAPAANAGTILVVEDAHPFRRLIREVLGAAGYRVLEAATPGEALELTASHGDRIDLVLTDVVMPEMHGHELAALLRARRPRLRVVYMSGFSEEIVSAAERADFPFLQKPFSSEVLLRTLREALGADRSENR